MITATEQYPCPHEDNIEYGETVFKDANIHVVLVQCTTCGAYGAQYETFDQNDCDYYPQAEAWHTAPLIGGER